MLAAVLLAPAAALAAAPGHIVLKDGLTLAQQFGYQPDYRQHVVTFDAGNVPSIRSRGANEDDTAFVQRLENGAWVRHDLLEALRDVYPDFAGTVHAGGYGTDRVDWDVDGRAYTVLTIRLDDDGGFRNVLMASADGMQTWQVLELPFGDSTPQTDPHDWGNVTSEHQGARPLEGPPLIAVWRQLAPWHGQWASLDELDVIKPYWSGGTLLLRPPVAVSDIALRAAAVLRRGLVRRHARRHQLLRVLHLRPQRHPGHPHLRRDLRRLEQLGERERAHRQVAPGQRPALHAGHLRRQQGHAARRHRRPRLAVPLRALHVAVLHRRVDAAGQRHQQRLPDQDHRRGRRRQADLPLHGLRARTTPCTSSRRQVRRGVDEYYPGQGYDALVHTSLAPGASAWSTPDLVVVPPQAGLLAVLPEAHRGPPRPAVRLVQLLLPA